MYRRQRGYRMSLASRKRTLRRWAALVAAAFVALMLFPLGASADPPVHSVLPYNGLTSSQKATLRSIAADTWKFYNVDVDPNTNLPLDNVTFAGGSSTP